MENLTSPTDCLSSLVDGKELVRVLAGSCEVTNLAKVLKLSVGALVEGAAVDPSNSDENLGALISILLDPSEGVKSLPGFADFRKAAETRILAMVRKALVDMASPLLKSVGARKMLAFLDSKGPGLSGSFQIEADKESLDAAQKAGEAIAKTFNSWLHKQLPDFGASMCPEKTEEQGEAADDPTGLASTDLEIWMVCILPRCLKVFQLSDVALQSEVSLLGDLKVGAQKYEEFVKEIVTAHAELQEFKSHVLVTDVGDGSEGKKILATNKFAKAVEGNISGAASGVVKGVLGLQSTLRGELDAFLKDEALCQTEALIEQGCSDRNMDRLLEIAQSKASRGIHNSMKQFEHLSEIFIALDGLKQLGDLTDVWKSVQGGGQSVNEAAVVKGKELNCALATIQALWRPLKSGETRGALARRARVMITSRGVKVQPNLDLFLTKKAAIVDKAEVKQEQ